MGMPPIPNCAALTGLRKRGFAIRTVRAAGETTRYRLAAEAMPDAEAATTKAAKVGR